MMTNINSRQWELDGENEPMDDLNSEWQRKGATLSDKTTREEYGLTQDEILRTIAHRKLQCREGSVYGSPFLRLLRREVEALVEKKRGSSYLADRLTRTELSRIDRELKRLKKQIATRWRRGSQGWWPGTAVDVAYIPT